MPQQYIITTDRSLLETYQAQVDALPPHYPETQDRFVNVGPGPHAPWTVGRAMHYAEIMTDQTGLKFALPYDERVPVPEGCEVGEELPSDWFPEFPEGL